MGFRMSVCQRQDLEESDKWFGDDHKLYGYVALEDVKDSFLYISKFMRRQWTELDDDLYNDPDMIYTYICVVNGTSYVDLTADEFKEFTKLYLEDVRKNTSAEVYEKVSKYMNELANKPTVKYIWWC